MNRSHKHPGIIHKSFIIQLAWRNLRSHKLRTFLTLFGVIIGISAIVFLLAFAYGIQRVVTQQVSSGNALLLLDVDTGNSQIVKIDEHVVSVVENIPNVKRVYALTGVAAKSEVNSQMIDLGVFGSSQTFLSLSGVTIKAGNYFEANSLPQMIVSSSYAQLLGGNFEDLVGKKVSFNITIPKELASSTEDINVDNADYIITGVFQDDTNPKAYVSYLNLEKLGLVNFTQIKVEANSADDIVDIRAQIEGLGLQTRYIGDTISQINQVFAVFKAVLASFGVITLAVSLLGMFNTLTISLLERMREIALMKILGMRHSDIRQVFLAESLLLGVAGGILGILVGLITGQVANFILNLYAASSGGEAVSIFYYPVFFMFVIFIISVLIGYATGWYPARRATRVNPLDVLRYE